jgi:cell division protease FtsH
MSTIKQSPNQPYLDPGSRFDWEKEETLVDSRKRLRFRIWRNFRRSILPVSLLSLVLASLLDPVVMQTVLNALSFIFRLMFAIAYIIFQFVIMFWFLARTRMYTIMPGAEGVSFKDYRGQPEILEQANQVVTLLRGVKAFEGAGGEPLTGLLLEGPPGTGKTWLAQAISTEAGVPFFYMDTSSLQAMFMGVGPMKVMRLYAKARKAAKEYGAAVIFLDEIDAIGSRGGVAQVGGGSGTPGGAMGGMGGDMGLLSTMLIEMSGFSLEHGWRAKLRTWWYKTILRRNPPQIPKRVLTIGATNRVAALDAALLRPGRFDKKLRIDVPDMAGRRDIMEYYLSKMAHDDSMNAAILSTETPGYSPADLKYVLNEALRYAFFEGRRYMTYADFQAAKPEHEMGLRSPLKTLSKEARERLAYREAGYAVAIRLFLPEHRIARITTIRQGSQLAHVKHYPASERYTGMMTVEQYMDQLRVAVARKATEIEFNGAQNQSLGSSENFDRIRWLLRAMAGAGMFGTLGAAVGLRMTMMGVATEATPEMAAGMEEVFQQVVQDTRTALRANAHIVKALAEILMEKDEMISDEVQAFFDQFGLHTPDPTMIKDGEAINLLPDEVFKPLPATATANVHKPQ